MKAATRKLYILGLIPPFSFHFHQNLWQAPQSNQTVLEEKPKPLYPSSVTFDLEKIVLYIQLSPLRLWKREMKNGPGKVPSSIHPTNTQCNRTNQGYNGEKVHKNPWSHRDYILAFFFIDSFFYENVTAF